MLIEQNTKYQNDIFCFFKNKLFHIKAIVVSYTHDSMLCVYKHWEVVGTKNQLSSGQGDFKMHKETCAVRMFIFK